MKVARSRPLAPLTTLQLGGPARFLVDAHGHDDVEEARRLALREGLPVLVLGGGSNLVVADAGVEAVVLRMVNRGVEPRVVGEHVEVDVAAGEPWDDVVNRCVTEGWAGVEALSGIPGNTGATPVQNVGAYGQEVGDTLVAVEAVDLRTGRPVTLTRQDCAPGYRTSRLKDEPFHVVTKVTLRLRRAPGCAPLRHGELATRLGGAVAPLATVREAVLALRRGKGMVVDPADPESRSAGSFFVNPVVDLAVADDVERRARAAGALAPEERMPRHPAPGGGVKLAAAWLIERAGFPRGWGGPRVGLSRKHVLALVHRGGGTTVELLEVARAVRDGVLARWGVALTQEPVTWGVTGVTR